MAEYWPLLSIAVLLAYPIYLLLMAGVLRRLGVDKAEIATWALNQAGRRRLIDLIRAARGLPDQRSEGDAPPPSEEEAPMVSGEEASPCPEDESPPHPEDDEAQAADAERSRRRDRPASGDHDSGQ